MAHLPVASPFSARGHIKLRSRAPHRLPTIRRHCSTDTNPSTETRIVDIVVNDGAGNSNTAQALIQVEVVNNSAPVLDLDADDSSGSFQSTFRNGFTENGALVPIA